MNKTDFIERVVQRLAEGKLRGMLGGLAQYHQQSTGQKPTISQLKGMGRGGMRAFSDIANRAQGRQVLGEKPQARNLSPEAKKGMDITYPPKDAPKKGEVKLKRVSREDASHDFINRTVGILVDRRLTEETKPSLTQRAVAAAKKRSGATVTQTDDGREVVEAPPKNPKRPTTLLATDRRGGVTIDTGTRTRDLASHQFIDRTVGILVDRIEELRQSTMKSAARQARAKAKALTKASGAAREGGAGGAASTLAIAAGGRTAQADRISQGAKARASGTPRTKPSERGGREAIAASNERTKAARQQLASHQNFIGKTVEILAEKLIGNQPEIDANGDKKITKKDFKILRKRKDEAINIDTSPEAQERFRKQDAAIRGAFDKIVNKGKPPAPKPTQPKKPDTSAYIVQSTDNYYKGKGK